MAVVLWPGGNHRALITEGMTQTHTPAVPFKMPPICANLKNNFITVVQLHDTYRAQSFTSLMADLRQDINRVSSFIRFLNGTCP